jgi:hypothetical protein
MRWLGGFCGLWAGLVWAQPPLGEAEAKAQAEVQTQRADGLIAVQPWVQVLGAGRLGVGWLTSQAADGVAEWTQDGAEADVLRWRQAWFSEDGLKQANGTSQRAVIEGYDPARPIRFRAVSRPVTAFKPYKVTFGEAVTSQERRLPALARPDGAVSFVVFNDVHNRYQNYPLLLARAGATPDFAVFNGDVIQDPQSEKELTEHLLLPMAWFAARSLPCFFLRGNHETRGAFARPMKDYLTLPDNRYYAAMTFGAARVLFLDSGEDKPDDSKEYSGLVDFGPYIEEELAWLKREIAGEAFRQATWRIAVMHIPPDWREEDAELWHGERRVRERFAPLFDEGKVHVVISGHNHKSEMIEPCPDVRRGFQWPVFVGGAPALTNATAIRVDATPQTLKVASFRSDGTAEEKSWAK